MPMRAGFLFVLAVLTAVPAPGQDVMTQERLEAFVRDNSREAEGGGGVVQFVFADVRMALVSDTTYDRMRLVAPIIAAQDLTEAQRAAVLEANFHTALDARYGTSDGILYAAFVHPLSSLDLWELASALRQVAALVHNFGTTYSSEALQFGGAPDDDDP